MSQTVELIDLEGDAQQRGVTHGEALRAQIRDGVDRWRDQLDRAQPLTPDAFIEYIHGKTQFVDTVLRQTPDLLEEVRGIAIGANLDFKTMFAFQLLDECWWLAARLKGETSQQESCSSLALASADGAPLTAQTMDLPLHYDGGQALLRFTDPVSGRRQLVFTVAGLIGLNGLNDKRLGLCVNTLSELDSSTSGLPVAFVARSLLAQQNIAAAVSFIESTNHASGQNYILASPEGIADIEAGAGATSAYKPLLSDILVYHTNHVLANSSARREGAVLTDPAPNTVKRLDAMERFFKEHPRPDLAAIRTLLSSADGPICAPRAPGGSFTFGACIMHLNDSPSLYVTHGPPTPSTFVEHKL